MLFMAALWNRAGHYILPCSLFFFLLSFFPRLISAVTDWTSTILPHMVWPQCEFRMQVWNVLHAARWKYSTQNIAKNSPSGIIAQNRRAISSQLRHVYRQSEKNLSNSNIFTCPYNMVNFGPL